MTYRLQVPVYHPVRMKVVKSLDHVHQLQFAFSSSATLGLDKQWTHQTNAVGIRVLLQVLNDVPIGRPLSHHLEGVGRDTKTLKDIRMV